MRIQITQFEEVADLLELEETNAPGVYIDTNTGSILIIKDESVCIVS